MILNVRRSALPHLTTPNRTTGAPVARRHMVTIIGVALLIGVGALAASSALSKSTVDSGRSAAPPIAIDAWFNDPATTLQGRTGTVDAWFNDPLSARRSMTFDAWFDDPTIGTATAPKSFDAWFEDR